MNNIIVRCASASDATSIAAIHCSSWRDAYANVLDPAFLVGPIDHDRRALWSARFNTPDERQAVFVAAAPTETLSGFICVYRDLDPQWGSLIDNLHVLPELRGKGIGEHLMRAAACSINSEVYTRGIHLWVFDANKAGLRFYQRLGGEVVERSVSEIPAANGAVVLRVFWPDLSVLMG